MKRLSYIEDARCLKVNGTDWQTRDSSDTATALKLCSPTASALTIWWCCRNRAPYFIFQKHVTGFSDVIYCHIATRYFKFGLSTKGLRVFIDLVYTCYAGGYPLSELHLMDRVFNSGILPLWDDVIIQRVCYCLRVLILRLRLTLHTCWDSGLLSSRILKQWVTQFTNIETVGWSFDEYWNIRLLTSRILKEWAGQFTKNEE